jgi:hypothetical protein
MKFSKFLTSLAAGIVASFALGTAAMAIPVTGANVNNANCASGVNGSATNNITTKKKATAIIANGGGANSSCIIDQNSTPGSINGLSTKNANVTNGADIDVTNNGYVKGKNTIVDINNQAASTSDAKVGQITTGVGLGNTSNAAVSNGVKARIVNNANAIKGSSLTIDNSSATAPPRLSIRTTNLTPLSQNRSLLIYSSIQALILWLNARNHDQLTQNS